MSVRVEHIGDATLYLGDCRGILPMLGRVDAVVTDPPYPDIDKGFAITPIDLLAEIQCRQLVFWSAIEPFPLQWSGIHIWHKPNGNSSQHYERIFERNGHATCKVYRHAAILPNYEQYKHECVDHPTQKPLSLTFNLVVRVSNPEQIILDPFMGSGTTGVACVRLGRRFVGIEIDPKYFAIACRRIEAATRQPDMFIERAKPVQRAINYDPVADGILSHDSAISEIARRVRSGEEKVPTTGYFAPRQGRLALTNGD